MKTIKDYIKDVLLNSNDLGYEIKVNDKLKFIGYCKINIDGEEIPMEYISESMMNYGFATIEQDFYIQYNLQTIRLLNMIITYDSSSKLYNIQYILDRRGIVYNKNNITSLELCKVYNNISNIIYNLELIEFMRC